MAVDCTPESLAAQAKCFECGIPPGAQLPVLIGLFCQIANNPSGGTPALPDGQIFVGNALNVATAVTMSKDATISDTGALTLANTATARSDIGLGTTDTPQFLRLGLGTAASAVNTLEISTNQIVSSSAVEIVSTWNAGVATVVGGMLLNVTDTSSDPTSALLNLQVSSNNRFTVNKTGGLAIAMPTVTSSSTANRPLDLSVTWNQGATVFTAIKLNVTNTASAAASLLMDLQVGSATVFNVAENGLITTTMPGLGSTPTDGHFLVNTTAAAAGAQQYSPAIHFKGFGWRTNATAASRAVEYRMYLVPVQAAATPSGLLQFESAINGGAFSNPIYMDTGARLGLNTTPTNSQLSIAYANTDFTNTAGANSHVLMSNSDGVAGQIVVSAVVAGTTRGKWRTDLAGNLSWIANGGDHDFYVGGDFGVGTSLLKLNHSTSLVQASVGFAVGASPGLNQTFDIGGGNTQITFVGGIAVTIA